MTKVDLQGLVRHAEGDSHEHVHVASLLPAVEASYVSSKISSLHTYYPVTEN